MPRGKKKSHKGGHRHFTNEDQLAAERARLAKEKEWRRQKGIESSEEEEEEVKGEVVVVEEGGATFARGAPGDLPPSDSETDSEDDEDHGKKGHAHLIAIENPNHNKKTTKKVSELGEGKTELSRREREELERQQAKEHYQRMHAQGKTEEARADLARLALIRKKREDAAKKKEEEQKERDDAKSAAEKKLLEKKAKQ